MSRKGTTSRHRAREVALQTLYAIDLGRRPRRAVASGVGEAPPADAGRESGLDAGPDSGLEPEAVLDRVAAHFEAPTGARAFAWELVSGVSEWGPALDEMIAERARNWRLSRMAAVDRNILRLGAYELAHTDTPAAVVLDEAVELARRYGSDASPAFVNGILDALAKQLREGGA